MQGNNIYKGFRYVPKNEGEWIRDVPYEALTVVQYQGNSYTSKICVPKGIDILDTRFWIQTANYNQQFENLRDTFNTTTAETIKELNDFKNKQDNEFADLLQSHKDNVNAYVDKMSKELEAEREQIQQGGLNDVINQVETIRQQNKQNIALKKKVGFNTFWSSSSTPISSLESAKYQVDKMLPMCDDIIHAQYCYYNSNNIGFYGDIEIIKNGINYAIQKGFKFKCLKFHLRLSDLTKELELEVAIQKYYEFVVSFLNNFESKPEFIEILNEDASAYTNVDYIDSIAGLLGKIKLLGYKVSIPIRTAYELYTLNAKIINACDVLSVNLYDTYSVNYKEATVEECKCAFDQHVNYFKYLINNYNKDIIISEVGVNASWDSLETPQDYFETNRSNLPPYLVLKSLLDSDLINYVSDVWLWYYVDTYNSPEASQLLTSYKNNGNVRG